MNKIEKKRLRLKYNHLRRLLRMTKLGLLILIGSLLRASAATGYSQKEHPNVNSTISPVKAYENNAKQEYIVSGIVSDATNGELLIGVSVSLMGTSTGVITDLSGHYNIKIPDLNATIVFSFIGYISEKVIFSGQSTVDVKLVPDIKKLDEVVVVGYGAQKKESVTASISTMTSKELTQSPAANISNMLSGRLSGLTAIQNTGKPGSDQSDLYIRGIGTYSEGNKPLIMVDGVARDSYNNIDPNEIESISILKDASATAVFGVRGANGVILIVTKRGQKGEPNVNFSAEAAMTRFSRFPRFANSYEYASLINEKGFTSFWKNHAKDADITSWDDFVTKREANWKQEAIAYYSDQDLLYYQNAHTPTLADGSANPNYDPLFHPDTDWKDQIFKKYSQQSKYNLNINGGTEGVKYFVSIGYLNQGGMFKTNYMPFPDESEYSDKRYNIRSNFDFDINKDFRVSVDLGYQQENISGLNQDQESWMWEKRIMWSTPISGPGIVDGKFVALNTNPKIDQNPLEQIASQGYSTNVKSTLTSSVKLTYKLDFILKGLSVNGRAAYDSYFKSLGSGGSYTPVWYSISPDPNGDRLHPIFSQMSEEQSTYRVAEQYNYKWRKIYGEASINYNRSFGKHNVGALVLYNAEKRYDPSYSPDLPHAYLGMVGRVTYDYDGKYLAEYNMGYNGSENFPQGKRFGFLPAYSMGWVTSKESFFPQNDIITFLKIRGSVGKVGNDNITVDGVSKRYLYLPDAWNYTGSYTFGTFGNQNSQAGAEQGTVGNPNVSWETATKSNLGFESKFLKDHLSVTYDYFNENRKDILSYRQTIPSIVQESSPPYNIGKVKNWGWELEASWKHNVGEVYYWVKGNVSYNKNKIVFMDEAITPGMEYQAATGKPVGQNNLLQSSGLYTSWSQLYETDSNGNPILSNPVLARNSKGETYTNTAGQDVYEKDLGYTGLPVQPGETRLKDVNEDGVIDSKDMMRAGKTTNPEYTFGVSFGLSYKGFDFSALFQGVSGVARYLNAISFPFGSTTAITEAGLNRFTLDRYNKGEQIDFPIPGWNSSSSYINSYFLKDASYVRLKNLEIGYSLSIPLLNKVGIKKARIYANGSNLYTWAGNKAWGDPENLGNQGYPLTQTFNLGININF
jgi:TonB-linked SusC/RagA family outer membrane protein